MTTCTRMRFFASTPGPNRPWISGSFSGDKAAKAWSYHSHLMRNLMMELHPNAPTHLHALYFKVCSFCCNEKSIQNSYKPKFCSLLCMKKKICLHLREEHRDREQGSGGAEKKIRTETTDWDANLGKHICNCITRSAMYCNKKCHVL